MTKEMHIEEKLLKVRAIMNNDERNVATMHIEEKNLKMKVVE